MSKLFSELCTPAKLYIILETILIIFRMYQGANSMSLLMNIAFVLVWTYVLGWICKKGFNIVSWILVLTPLFLVIFISKNANLNEQAKNNK